MVLGFEELSPYIEGHAYFGAMVGRVAGRLTGASFQLEGQIYRLAANDAGNSLHGGQVGFGKRVWRAKPHIRSDSSPSLRFELRSSDGDQGFPGDVEVTVDYTVTPDNTLLLETSANTTKATPFSLTNHSYFNLAGRGSGDDLLEHELQVCSDTIVPTDESFTLLDRLDAVDAGSDLRHPRRLREAVCGFAAEHGSMYHTGAEGLLQCVARLRAPQSGWMMECSTDAPYLQVYTGSHIEGPIRGKDETSYGKFSGLCLECQNYPNAVNAPHLDARGVLFAGTTQRTTIAYRFMCETRGHSNDPDD